MQSRYKRTPPPCLYELLVDAREAVDVEPLPPAPLVQPRHQGPLEGALHDSIGLAGPRLFDKVGKEVPLSVLRQGNIKAEGAMGGHRRKRRFIKEEGGGIVLRVR